MQTKTCSEYQNLSVIETNWIVICGCPSSGKSTTVAALRQRGFEVKPEYAREYYIDLSQAFIQRGLDILDIRSEANIPHNQEAIYRHRVETAKRSDPKEIIVFDTGIPESWIRLEMYAKQGLAIDQSLISEAQQESERYRYSKVFHLTPLDFVPDGIRIEDKEMIAKLDLLTRQAYERLGYDVILVPKFSNNEQQSIEERVEFIRSCI